MEVKLRVKAIPFLRRISQNEKIQNYRRGEFSPSYSSKQRKRGRNGGEESKLSQGESLGRLQIGPRGGVPGCPRFGSFLEEILKGGGVMTEWKKTAHRKTKKRGENSRSNWYKSK